MREWIQRISQLLRELLARWPRVFRAAGCRANVDAIWFNHDSSSLTSDALNIRRSYANAVDLPEWTAGKTLPEQSPAAYSIADTKGHSLTIKVRFTAPDPQTASAEVKAVGGGILGDLDPKTIHFTGGRSTPEFIEFALSHHAIGERGLHGITIEDIEWQWMYRCVGEREWHQADRTRHRVYVVLSEPTGPWKQQPFPDPQNPWTDALDLACSITGSPWTSDPFFDLAAMLSEVINGGGVHANIARLEYDIQATVSHYAWDTFDLTAFLDRWRGGTGNGPHVNCTDCACIITTLANLLGCDLWEGQTTGGDINAVMPIGFGQWWAPHFGFLPNATAATGANWLGFHEVAWRGDVVIGQLIYDVCYLVNGWEDSMHPQQPHPTIRVTDYPYGVIFADVATFDYQDKLAYRSGSIVPVAASKTRREVR